jgi:hypothetical protein
MMVLGSIHQDIPVVWVVGEEAVRGMVVVVVWMVCVEERLSVGREVVGLLGSGLVP